MQSKSRLLPNLQVVHISRLPPNLNMVSKSQGCSQISRLLSNLKFVREGISSQIVYVFVCETGINGKINVFFEYCIKHLVVEIRELPS